MGEAAEKVYPALTDAGVMGSLLMDVSEDCPIGGFEDCVARRTHRFILLSRASAFRPTPRTGSTEYSHGTLVPAGAAHYRISPLIEGRKAMGDDRSVVTLSPHATTAIVDAIQRAIIDKGASKATRKAAFSALLALVDAGLIDGNMPTSSPAKEETVAVQGNVSTRWFLTGHRGWAA